MFLCLLNFLCVLKDGEKQLVVNISLNALFVFSSTIKSFKRNCSYRFFYSLINGEKLSVKIVGKCSFEH